MYERKPTYQEDPSFYAERAIGNVPNVLQRVYNENQTESGTGLFTGYNIQVNVSLSSLLPIVLNSFGVSDNSTSSITSVTMNVSTSSGSFTIGANSVACVINMTTNSVGYYKLSWYVNGSTTSKIGYKNVGDLFFNVSRNSKKYLNYVTCFWLGSGSEFYFCIEQVTGTYNPVTFQVSSSLCSIQKE